MGAASNSVPHRRQRWGSSVSGGAVMLVMEWSRKSAWTVIGHRSSEIGGVEIRPPRTDARRPFTRGCRSVLGDGRIHIGAPAQDAPGEVVHLRDPRRLQL